MGAQTNVIEALACVIEAIGMLSNDIQHATGNNGGCYLESAYMALTNVVCELADSCDDAN